ncbi:MAG TPA: hypothetical protein VEQ10_14180 [Vicinamibacteria bacterium]|nr:hypothetical protein [Vicinamibacteria bacterium]
MKRHRRGLLVAAGLAAITAVQYGGVSWRNFGGVDEWLILSLNRQAVLSFPHTNRPLTLLWPLPARLLTPYGFEGYLLVHLAYSAAAGWLTWLLARRLVPKAPALAFTAGALAISWAPLDMARLAVVQTSVAMGVTAATLLAIVLFVESWRLDRLLLLAAAVVVAAAAARSYEAVLGLLFGAPLLLPMVPTATARGRRRVLLWVAAWEAAVLVLAVLAAAPLLGGAMGTVYQSAVLRLDPDPLRYLARLGRQYLWHLAPPEDLGELALPRTAATALVFVAAALLAAVPGGEAPSRKRLAKVAAAGLMLAGMGYSVLALSPATNGPTRMQFLSAPGIALFLSALVQLVASLLPGARTRAIAALVLAAGWVAAGAGHTQGMQREWDRISFWPRQRDCLTALVRQAPALREGSLLLLIDEDGTWPFALTFRHAGRLVYGDGVTAHALGSDQLLYRATMDAAGVRVSPWPIVQGPWHERTTEHRYDQVVVFRLSGGLLSRLDTWPQTQLGALPGGARYLPAGSITDAPAPPGRRVLD